jgi:ATP dependent DNA ligase-like protein
MRDTDARNQRPAGVARLCHGCYLPVDPVPLTALAVYDAGKLLYVGRTRNGFTPATRVALMKKTKPLEIVECPLRESAGASRRTMGPGPH